MLRLGALLALLCPVAALAGPWPREAGEGFVSTATEIRGFTLAGDVGQLTQFSSLYLEYGLTRSLTLGLSLGHGTAADTDARAFVSLPVYHLGGQRAALELSVGRVGATTYSGVALHYGRGFQVLGRDGWIAVEARLDHAIGAGFALGALRQSKLDLTLGLTHPNGLKTMAQVFNTTTGDDIYSTFAPGIAVPVGPNHQIETGLLIDLNDSGPPGVKIGLWHEF